MTGDRCRTTVAVLAAAVVLAVVGFAASAEIPENPDVARRYRLALESYEARRYDEARRAFEALAGEGVAQAEFMLGVMYEYGDGVDASYSDAAHWYEAAAERGLTSAETRLGTLHIAGTGVPPDLRLARQWLERAARKRDPLALVALGDLSARGQGVPQSLEDAYAYYLLAKDTGSDKADAAIANLDAMLSPGRRAEAARRAARLEARLLEPTASGGSDEEAGAEALPVRRAESLRLSPVSIRDAGLGGTALHLLAPRGWKVSGGVIWRSESALPADLELRVESEDASLGYSTLARRAYVWRSRGDDEKRPFITPRGYEAEPPVGDAVVFVEREVLPQRHRAGSYQVLERRPLPSVARVVAGGVETRAPADVSAARVRVRVQADGRTFDEDVYCVLLQTRSRSGPEELVFWGPERLYALRAPEGRLDEHYAVLQSIASSVRFDDAWTGRYSMLRADLRDRPGRSRISDRELELFLQSARDSHANARSAVALEEERLRARINAALAAELGGTETFFDLRSEREVSLPRGFARAWTSGNGDYLVTSDPSYDPRSDAPAEGWAELHAVSAR